MAIRIPIALKLVGAIAAPMLLLTAYWVRSDFEDQRAAAVELMGERLSREAQGVAARLDAEFRTAAAVASALAAMIELEKDPPESLIWSMLDRTMGSPVVYGSCVAFEPGSYQGKPGRFAPYIHRRPDLPADAPASTHLRKDIAESYDYTDPVWEWYDQPRQTGKPVWTEPYFDKGGGEVNMCTVAVPIFRDGKFRGVSTADVRLDGLDGLTARLSSGDRERFIISPNGTLISAPDPSAIVHKSVAMVADELKREDLRDLGRRMMAGESGTVTMRGFKNEDAMLVSFAPIPSTGWSYATAVPEQSVMGPVFADLRQNLLEDASRLLFVGVVVIGATWWIMRPARRLSVAVRSLGEGKFEIPPVATRSRDEVGDLARAFDGMVKSLREHVDALRRETKARESVESELRVAREIQRSLLPRVFPGSPEHGFEIAAINEPAESVGGDFYDAFEAGDRVAIVVADVSGKGVPAALLMAVSRTIIRNVAAHVGDPAAIMRQANAALADDDQNGMFVTAFFGLYTPRTGELSYVNAGHVPPLIVKADGECRATCAPTGTVLGVLPDAEFAAAAVRLAPGESLVVVTDGVTEARPSKLSAAGMFGEEGVINLVRSIAGEGEPRADAPRIGRAIVDTTDALQPNGRVDDTTVLVLRRM